MLVSRRVDKPTCYTTITITASSYPQKPPSFSTYGGFFCYHLTSYSQSPFYRENQTLPVFTPSLHFEQFLHFLQCALCGDECLLTCPFSPVSTHVVSLFFSNSFVSPDVHIWLPIPLSSGSLNHEQAPTSAPSSTPRLTSHHYPICIHLSPLSNLSNLSYRVILFCSQLRISLSMPDILTLSLSCSIAWEKNEKEKKPCGSPSQLCLLLQPCQLSSSPPLQGVNHICWGWPTLRKWILLAALA